MGANGWRQWKNDTLHAAAEGGKRAESKVKGEQERKKEKERGGLGKMRSSRGE